MSLLEAATKVREQAYAPYSNFKVGAAIRTTTGAVFSGCNVENVAYPEGTCAEAGAIAAMIAAGARSAVIAVISGVVSCDDVGTGIRPTAMQARNAIGKSGVLPRRSNTRSPVDNPLANKPEAAPRMAAWI